MWSLRWLRCGTSRFVRAICARSSRSISSSFHFCSRSARSFPYTGPGQIIGWKKPVGSTRLGAVVRGRHFTFSHSLVSARCSPTSRPGFSRSRRAASGNHGPTAINSTSRITPSR